MVYKVLIFSDFDGTITGRPGQDLVFSPFYQGLLIGYKEGKVLKNYKSAPMLEEKGLIDSFTKAFGPYDAGFNYKQENADVLMTADAVAFYHRVLKKPQVRVSVITKNRVEYTRAIFKYHGFSEEEIQNLNIIDKFLSKQSEVQGQIEGLGLKNTAERVYILDDNFDDWESMIKGAEQSGYEGTKIKKCNNDPGAFEWADYLKEIESLAPLQEEQSEALQDIGKSSEEEPISNGTSSQSTDVSNKDKSDVDGEEFILPKIQNIRDYLLDSPHRTSFFVMMFVLIGFGFGFGLGILSLSGGYVAPFGLGTIGFGSLSGAALGGFCSLLGLDYAKSSEPTPDELELSRYSSVFSSSASLYLTLPSSPRSTLPDAEPKHYSSILSKEAEVEINRQLDEDLPCVTNCFSTSELRLS